MDNMENTEGKRVLPQKKIPLWAKIAIIAGAATGALLAGGYLGLCAYVSGGGTVVPNTTAAGVALGGLTRTQAEEKIAGAGAQRFGSQTLTFTYPGGTGEVPGTWVALDAAGGAEAAHRLGRENGFLGGGLAYLTAFFGGTEVETPVLVSPEGEARFDGMVAEIEDHLTQRVEETTYRSSENALLLVKGVPGMSVDAMAVRTNILAAFQADKGTSTTPAFDVVPQVTAPAEPDFNAIYNDLHMAAADAYLDKTTKEIVPSVTGVSFDIATAQALLERTDDGAVCRVPLALTEPEMTTEKLTEHLFKDLLGSTKTYAAGPSQRRYNIKLACSFVNDTILLPGEEFSYNGACEPYSVSNGYQNAGTYQNGKSVDATAGGICQLSSTLYWATLEANLEIVERSKHAFDGGYMPIVGTDATVFSGAPDFKFKNNTIYPIKLEAYMESNNVFVNVYGTTNGLHGEPFNKVVSTVAAQKTYQPSAAVPQGSEPQKDPEQYALNGITVEVYLRVVDADGKTVDTQFLHKDTYRKRDAVYHYNPADAALWGIDPATGLQTLAPVVPTPSPDPGVVPPVDPGVTDPATSPAPGTDPGAVPGTDPVVTPDPTQSENLPPPGIPVDLPTPMPSASVPAA